MTLTVAYSAAYVRSLRAVRNIEGYSVPLHTLSDHDHKVAHVVALEADLRAAEFDRLHRPTPEPKKATPKLLGCYVDGVLRFQSRDHDAIHEYAARKMKPRTMRLSDGSYRVITANVWVAPVGSFIDAEKQAKLEKEFS